MEFIQTFYTQVIPVGLWMVMLGMGLSLTPNDIKNTFLMPKAVSIGLIGQIILLPILAFIIAVLFAPTQEIAVGLIILAACPGGVTSNAYSFASRADVALSVSLTTITSFITILTLPIITYLAINFFIDKGVIPKLPVMEMMYTLAKLSVFPIIVGMSIRHIWSEKAAKLVELLRSITFIFLMVLVLAGSIVSFDVLRQYFLQTAIVAVSFNVLGMLMGFALGKFGKLSVAQSVSITFEVGVQNISLASLVALSLLQNEAFFVVTLIYAVIMKVTALSFMYFATKWLRKEEMIREDVFDIRASLPESEN